MIVGQLVVAGDLAQRDLEVRELLAGELEAEVDLGDLTRRSRQGSRSAEIPFAQPHPQARALDRAEAGFQALVEAQPVVGTNPPASSKGLDVSAQLSMLNGGWRARNCRTVVRGSPAPS